MQCQRQAFESQHRLRQPFNSRTPHTQLCTITSLVAEFNIQSNVRTVGWLLERTKKFVEERVCTCTSIAELSDLNFCTVSFVDIYSIFRGSIYWFRVILHRVSVVGEVIRSFFAFASRKKLVLNCECNARNKSNCVNLIC